MTIKKVSRSDKVRRILALTISNVNSLTTKRIKNDLRQMTVEKRHGAKLNTGGGTSIF